MSQIEGMGIIGIRSFSPEDASYIKFHSPLTLIVGENGCGKTTIIESLKYACTGELPPNSKGGAFVNDPRLSGKREVKGQIKLKFSNINGQKMVCSRSLSVTMRPNGGLTQKTIDSSLLRFDPITKESFSISSRCADMDAELPLHLGVPKAILENVIFCHQEESNWPFSESSILKKKFDDIFDSKRYQVALENIKNIRKEKASEINVGNARLEGLKSDTLKAKKIRMNLTQMNQQVAAKNESLQSIETKLQQLTADSTKLNDIFRELNLTQDQIQQIINKKDFFQSTLNSLDSHITPRSESTEELERMLNTHRSSQNATELKKSDITREKIQLERQLKNTRDTLSQKYSIMGRLEATQDEYERQLKARTELIEKANEENNMNLPTCDGIKTAAVLKKNLHLRSLQNEKAKNDAMAKQNALSDELQLLKSRLLSIQESKKYLMERIEREKIQINILNKKIENYQASHTDIDEAKAKIEEYKIKLSKVNENISGLNNTELIKKERELRNFDDMINDLNEELSTLSKQGDIRAKLSLKRSDKESKEADMLKLYQGRIDDCERLIKSRPSIENFEKELYAYKIEKDKNLRVLIEKRNEAQRELSKTDGKLNMVRHNLTERQREASKYETMCKQVCGDRSLPAELKATESKIEEVKDRLCNLSAVDSIYAKYMEGTQEAKCCPLCVRGFNDDSELNEFFEKLQHKKKGFPVLKTQMETSLAKLNTRVGKLKSVQGAWIKLEQLRSDIAGIQSTFDALTFEKENASRKAEKATIEQAEMDDNKIKTERLLIVAGNVSRILKEVQTVTNEIQNIELELEFSGSTRTIPDCQKDLEDIVDKSKIIRRDIKRIQSDNENSRRQAQSIENTIRDYERKLSDLEHKLNFRCGLDLQLEEMNENLVKQTNECNNIEADVDPLNQKVIETTLEYEKAVQSWRIEEEAASQEERQMSRLVDRLDEMNKSITRNEATISTSKIDQIKSEIVELESLSKGITAQINEADERLSIIEKDEVDRRGIERDLEDQIRYRKSEMDLKKCEEELAELEENHHEYDMDAMKRELNKLEREESMLIDKRGSIRGELAQLRDQVKRYEHELKTDYKDIDGIYAELYISVKTTELASADLLTYSKVLETAIMKYHSLKMDDLNTIIKDLWFKTYKGGDIDYIAIRADNENIAKNRSFNYRVVMFQGGNELDMKGRCSAGQKVLASIIIRLALAETFCVNCGFFALDEPTTNLDHQNVVSLAENLKAIIAYRKEQTNFQFVIITHDEHFVDYLGGSDLIDQYYRVSKENGHSVIKAQGEGTSTL